MWNETTSVSVLIDTYNQERFIEQAILSVLEQDFPSAEMEILVIDDGSTDRTPEIVRKVRNRVCAICANGMADKRLRSIWHSGASSGEIVAFLDGDDWWMKNKMQLIMSAFEKNPQRVPSVTESLKSIAWRIPPLLSPRG